MLEEGESVPGFELPAVHEGERETIALGDYLGDDILILAFYPGDFNPACADGETGLDDLDLFTMQKDVSILAVSGDSIFSHEVFADEYDLHIPLLSDVDGTVARSYGVESDAATHQTRRTVFVVDHTGTVEFAWQATEIDDLPDVDELRAAVEGVGGDETARARYRVGNARYREGRRAFTSAMGAYEDREWMMARSDFTQACEEFDTAREEFNTAIRFAEDATEQTYFERAEQKAEALWRAADWLGKSANAFASGQGAEAERLRQDAEAPLETARDIHEPPDPDDFPPDEDPAERTDDVEEASLLPDDEDEQRDTSLDLDESATETDEQPGSQESADTTATAEDGDESTGSTGEIDDEEDIDDDELEEIAAELEQQTAAATQQTEDEITVGDEDGDRQDGAPTDGHEATGDEHVEGELDEDDIELDLTDPTEGEDDEDEDDERELPEEDLGGSGDHGVPDSL